MKMSFYVKRLSVSVLAIASLLSLPASGSHELAIPNRCSDLSLVYISDSRVAVVAKAPFKSITAARLCLDGECSNGVRHHRYFISEFDATLDEYYAVTVEKEHKRGHKRYNERTLLFANSNCLDDHVTSAPGTIAGKDVVLTITDTQSDLPEGYPTMGAVVQSYANDGTYDYQGFGGDYHLTGSGTYNYQRTGLITAEENAMQTSDTFTLPYTMEYTFETNTSGRWTQDFAGGVIVFSGTFTTHDTNTAPYAQYAPESLAGYTLLTRNDENRRDITVEDYRSEGTYHAHKSPAMDFTTSEYDYKKLSSSSAIVESTPHDLEHENGFVRVYTFATPVWGTWYEKSRNGVSEKSGRFWVIGQE